VLASPDSAACTSIPSIVKARRRAAIAQPRGFGTAPRAAGSVGNRIQGDATTRCTAHRSRPECEMPLSMPEEEGRSACRDPRESASEDKILRAILKPLV
jgi:hypothetical protein